MPAVRDPELENATMPSWRHAQAAELEAPHDRPRRPDDHDDAHPHPHRDPVTHATARREEDERVVIARLSPGRKPRRDRDRRAPPGSSTTRCGRSSASRQRTARRRRDRRSRGRPLRSRREPARRRRGSTDSCPRSSLRIVVRPDPASSTCSGEAVSATGGRAPLAPADAGTSTSGQRPAPTRAAPIIGRRRCR